jgi:uncharacterized protein YjbJ (UPF0337 family)
MNRDEIEGKVTTIKGKVKEQVAKVTDNPDLYDEAVTDQTAGETQEAFGTAKRKVGEVIEKVGKAIKK